MHDVERIGRLAIVMLAMWAAVYAVIPGNAPAVLQWGQVALGVVGALVCVVVAVRPTVERIQIAFFGSAVYGVWNAVRLVVVSPQDARAVIRGATTFGTLAVMCLAMGAATGILGRIDAIARDLDDDQ